MSRGRMVGFVALTALTIAGCARFRSTQTGVPKSLYERLGGKPAIQAVVDDFVWTVVADARINRYFAGANIPRLKGHLVDQICQASGGPCKYVGRSMQDAHRGMGVTGPAFDALVEDLASALDRLKVPEAERGELLAMLGPMKGDIVER